MLVEILTTVIATIVLYFIDLAILGFKIELIEGIKDFIMGRRKGKKLKNCMLTMEIQDGKVLTHASEIDMVQLATMCGALEQLMGLEALKRGKSLDDVKDNMLDIHLAAMQALTEQVRKETHNGRKEKAHDTETEGL